MTVYNVLGCFYFTDFMQNVKGRWVVHSISPPPYPKTFPCARLNLTPGIGPQVYRKNDISRHDRTTERSILHRPIPTKPQDLSRGQKKAGWAKYAYFSTLTRKKSWWATFVVFTYKKSTIKTGITKSGQWTFGGLTRKNFSKKNFGGLTSTGLLLLCVGFGLAIPSGSIQARAYSYLNSKSSGVDVVVARSEAQTSQTIPFLEAAVNIDPKKAQGGGDITVVNDSALLPEEGPSGTLADVESNDYQGGVSLYVVHEGDTIAQVAKMFEVSENTILWANGLSSSAKLRAGQTLAILPIDGVQHTVKKGETIGGIAKKYGGRAADILEFNNLVAGQTLSLGDTIVIPNGKEGLESGSSSSSGTSPLSRSRARLIASYPSYSGYYINPLPSGHRNNAQGIHGYNGVDLDAPKGDPVYAAADGIVTASFFRTGDPWFGGYGNYIDINHPNGTQTRYGHLSAVYVQVGAQVNQGQSIGEVGSTGHSTGPHLHFEVHGAKNPF